MAVCFYWIFLYLFIKKNPIKSRGLLTHANNIIKYMPVDRNTKDILTPLFDFSAASNGINQLYADSSLDMTPQTKNVKFRKRSYKKKCK